jgi:hypothetical protein
MSLPAASNRELSRATTPSGPTPASLVWAPLLAALVALAGSLWLSVGMRLKACPLCFYQRTFVMGVVAILGIGLLTGARHRGVLNLLALPLAVAGLTVAVFHVYLEITGKLECPDGILGLGTAPKQSLAALTVLLILIVVGVARSGSTGEPQGGASVAAVVVGMLLAGGAVVSAPPMPPSPTKAYEIPLDICRPPFRPQ